MLILRKEQESYLLCIATINLTIDTVLRGVTSLLIPSVDEVDSVITAF